MVSAITTGLSLLAAMDLAAIASWHMFANPRSQWLGPALHRGSLSRKAVALTFDDGPCEPFTTKVLDILARENVRATFFVCGRNVDMNPQTARRIVEDGHLIGNHTYSHPYLYFRSRTEIRAEIELSEQAIERATGRRCRFFRPPYGARWMGLYPELESKKMELVAWSSWPEIHSTADEIVIDVLNHLRPGAVYLLHDGIQQGGGYFTKKTFQPDPLDPAEQRVERMVEALPMLIREIRAQGYEFVDVAQMFEGDVL